jgi:hypothetical protein
MRDHRELLSRAEGCWTFDARDRMPRSSRLPVHAITAPAENAPNTTRTPPARAGSFSAPNRTLVNPMSVKLNLAPPPRMHRR